MKFCANNVKIYAVHCFKCLHDQAAATNSTRAPKSKDSSSETSVSIKAQKESWFTKRLMCLFFFLFFFYMQVLFFQQKQSKSDTTVAQTWEDSPYMFIIKIEANPPPAKEIKSSIKCKIIIRHALTVIMRFM